MIKVFTAITANHDPARSDIEVLTETLGASPLQAARRYKWLAPEVIFADADWTIWLDGNVFLNVEPEVLVAKCGDADFGVFTHSHHENILQEYIACVHHFPEMQPGLLRARNTYAPREAEATTPAMTMVVVRRNNKATQEASWKLWTAMFDTGCYRDQLLFPKFFPGPYWPAVDFTQPNEFFTRIEA